MASLPAPDLGKSTPTVLMFLKVLILASIGGAAVSSRLFAVVRFESIIHEFDPWFNFRATKILTELGVTDFWNWFDATAWYPLGKAAGGTLYPGLMLTSATIFNILHALNLPVDIREVCVMLAPAFSGLTALATYLFAREVGRKEDGTGGEGAGLWAALFIGIAPGYISRSVAGSYDNEAIAIFILTFTFYLWLKAMREGSALWATFTALFYYYMVSAWGGYAFITNLLPLHVFALLIMGRFTTKIYVVYSTYYALGTLAAMSVPFVNIQPIRNSEHMAALGVFGLLQLVAFGHLVNSHLPAKQFRSLLIAFVVLGTGLGTLALVFLTRNGWVAPWTGRFYSLWDHNYAKVHIPIIASVSEHQPTAWPSFFFDLQLLIYLFPAGVYLCFRTLRNEHVFVIAYALVASYFAGVMVRLMLTLTPIVCVVGGVVVDRIFETYLGPSPSSNSGLSPVEKTQEAATSGAGNENMSAETDTTPQKPKKAKKKTTATQEETAAKPIAAIMEPIFKSAAPGIAHLDTRLSILAIFTFLLSVFCLHCTWVTSTAYSSPSVVLASRAPNGEQSIIDDFREAYYWIRQNTEKDAKVMSWWDYGYQLAGFADRTTLVDNATWNNTHIAAVGKAMSCREEISYPILRAHDVDYVLIVFGGLIGFSGDDINKFLWMIRISEGIWPEDVSEGSYFNRGQYLVDENASETMKNSLMYKMSYHRFAELYGGQQAMDRVRNQRIPSASPTLDTLEEAFTSENWIVRIYKVKKPDILGRSHKQANAFNDGHRKKKSKIASTRARRRLITA